MSMYINIKPFAILETRRNLVGTNLLQGPRRTCEGVCKCACVCLQSESSKTEESCSFSRLRRIVRLSFIDRFNRSRVEHTEVALSYMTFSLLDFNSWKNDIKSHEIFRCVIDIDVTVYILCHLQTNSVANIAKQPCMAWPSPFILEKKHRKRRISRQCKQSKSAPLSLPSLRSGSATEL